MRTNIKSVIRYLLLLLSGILISASLSYAQDNEKQLSKDNLKGFIEFRLTKANLLNNENIKVEVLDNKIILSGTVPTVFDKNQAELETHSVDENYLVVNNIIVESPIVADSVLTSTILNKIQSNVFYGIFDWLTASSKDGVVTLAGWVHLPWLKNQFQTEIEKIPGVKSVNNEVQNTFGPGEIGVRAARLIYNDPMFYGMQYSANAPIHIIVNNATVILKGNVNSEVQSRWAENIISFRTDAFSVENNLQVKK
jgi:osmotically-inducible protein OsmY